MLRSRCLRQSGSISFTAIASLLALSLGSLYVFQSNQKNAQSIDSAIQQGAQEQGSVSNLSDLALTRGLLSEAKIPGSLKHAAAVFPSDYFANTWDLKVNNAFNLKAIKASGNRITVPTFADDSGDPRQSALVFNQSKTQASALIDAQTLEIVRLNPDPLTPFFISSVDVRVSRQQKIRASGRTKTVDTFGRIGLSAPLPSGARIQIKGPGDADFNDNFGSQTSPRDPGNFSFRILGSGVVHFARLSGGGVEKIVGIDDNQRITHQARNILARDVEIGIVDDLPGIGEASEAEQDIVQTGCSFDVANTVESDVPLPAGVEITAQLVGVDGLEVLSGQTTKELFIKPKAAAPKPVIVVAENNICPNSCASDSVLATDDLASKHYDLSAEGTAPRNKIDVFEGGKTDEIKGTTAQGILCGNYELVGQEIVRQVPDGGTANSLFKSNFGEYTRIKDEAMALKRIFAYLAPACQPQLVGTRGSCGCFAEGTQILMADGSTQAAASIRAGDRVWNPKTKRAQAVKHVIAGPERWPLLNVRVGDQDLLVTGEHPFLTRAGLKAAHRLRVGDQIIDGDAVQTVTEVSAQKRAEGETDPEVWNFELVGSENPDEHYVLANGIMTGDLYLQMKLQGQAAVPRTVVSE